MHERLELVLIHVSEGIYYELLDLLKSHSKVNFNKLIIDEFGSKMGADKFRDVKDAGVVDDIMCELGQHFQIKRQNGFAPKHRGTWRCCLTRSSTMSAWLRCCLTRRLMPSTT